MSAADTTIDCNSLPNLAEKCAELGNLSSAPANSLAILIAGLALGVSWWAAMQSRKAAQAQIIAPFLDEYSTPEMFTALQTLSEARDQFPSGRRDEWIAITTRHDARKEWENFGDPYEKKEFEKARRKLNQYYIRAYKLYENGFLTKKAMRIIVQQAGYQLLFDVVWPIMKIRHLVKIDGKAELFDWYGKLKRDFPLE